MILPKGYGFLFAVLCLPRINLICISVIFPLGPPPKDYTTPTSQSLFSLNLLGHSPGCVTQELSKTSLRAGPRAVMGSCHSPPFLEVVSPQKKSWKLFKSTSIWKKQNGSHLQLQEKMCVSTSPLCGKFRYGETLKRRSQSQNIVIGMLCDIFGGGNINSCKMILVCVWVEREAECIGTQKKIWS